MKHLICVCAFFTLLSCSNKETPLLTKGVYRAELTVQDNQILPFIFEVENETSIKIFNADEIIEVDEITYENDSVRIQPPVFEGYIIAAIKDEVLTGSFVKESLDRVVPFKASKSSKRFFTKSEKTSSNITGVWETVFTHQSEEDKYIAKGIFTQKGNKVAGTFRTTTGDYRFLEGVMDTDSLRLSVFDGAHAFLFQAKVTDSTMSGIFYSGNHWKTTFIAKRNDQYELPSANELTFLKEGYDRFDFSFENENGELISLQDNQFQNRVVLVQVMGSWCPNCLDESKYYTQYLQEHPNDDLKFVALAFENAKTKDIAWERIRRLKERIQVPYPILLAQYGTSDKKLAQEKLPMLNHVLSYPTTIYIEKKGKVRKIHTGFNGPATGQKYLDFKKEFEGFVSQLLKE